MITDHFRKDQLDKLFDLGFHKHDLHDDSLSMTYYYRGETMQSFITHEDDGTYTVGVVRVSTQRFATAILSAEDFDSFLEEEFIHAEPGDESPGSGGGGGK